MAARTWALAAAVWTLAVVMIASQQAVAQNPADYVLTFAPVQTGKNAMIETASNPMITAANLTAAINRVTLPPCGVRNMHIHRGVDEIYFAVDKSISVAFSDPSGMVTNVDLQPGTAVGVPKNTIHTVYNPDCEDEVVFLSFYNQFAGAASNVGLASLDMPSGPFKAYAAPDKLTSLQNAVNAIFAVDPACLARCNLGPQFDQEPADAAK